eukprot:370208-Pleurochrysis_carterae.AAC.3
MHNFPNCICIACVLTARSHSAPQALGCPRARDGRHCPLSAPPRATAQARPSPRARASSRPATHAWLKRAWSLRVGLDDRIGPRAALERLLGIFCNLGRWPENGCCNLAHNFVPAAMSNYMYRGRRWRRPTLRAR